jgi:uncharacterized protein YkwD
MSRIRIEVPGRTFLADLPERPVRIGSSVECELRLRCEGVAKVHCVIDPLPDGRHRLRDLASGLPLLVNDLEVQQVALRPGDRIQVGEARIEYGATDPVPAPPRPAPPPAAPPREDRSSSAPRPARGARRLVGPIAATAAAGVLAIIVAIAGFGGGGGSGRAEREMEKGEDLLRARRYAEAAEVFDRIAADRDAGDLAAKAERFLARARAGIADAELDLAALEKEWQDFDLGGSVVRRDLLVARHGDWVGARVDEVLGRLRTRQDAWARERIEEGKREAVAAAEAGKFAEARDAWERLRRASVRADFRAATEEGISRVETEARTAAEALLARAAQSGRSGGPDAERAEIEAARGRYRGTAADSLLSARLAALATAPAPVVSPSLPVPPEPSSEPAPPPGSSAVAEAAEAALLEADRLAKERRFRPARAALDTPAPAEIPDPPLRARFEGRRDDLDLAREGLDLLAKDIRENPNKYRGVPITARVTMNLVGADEETVSGTLAGGRAAHRWATLAPDRVAGIVERWAPAPASGPAAASLLREWGASAAAEARLFATGEGGGDRARVFSLVARWRGEAVPEGGYQVHRGEYLTPAERERRIFEERVADAVTRLDAREPAERRKACEELLALGDAAKPRLLEALRARRDRQVAALAADRAFTSQKTRLRLHEELERRRRAALAFIFDAARYPYPSADHKGQAEVDALVEQVREVWERPFDLVAQWDDGVRKGLEGITETDESIRSVDPAYAPDLEALRERASLAVDMPSVVPTPQAQADRDYTLAVLAYNERVGTTATAEEKANVLAVNEYRRMMGRPAVRIHERLVRSARGHSRWMSITGIFSHDNTQDPALRSPGDRARRQGYAGGVGENIAWGTHTGWEAFRAWYGSSGHHRNMLSGWAEMGAGRVVSDRGPYWTQNFGGAGGRSLEEPEPLAPPSADVAPQPEESAPGAPGPGAPRVPDDTPGGGN